MEYAGHKSFAEAVTALKCCAGLAVVAFVLGLAAASKNGQLANAARLIGMIFVVAVGAVWSQTSLLHAARAYNEVNATLVGLSSMLIVLSSAAGLGLLYNTT